MGLLLAYHQVSGAPATPSALQEAQKVAKFDMALIVLADKNERYAAMGYADFLRLSQEEREQYFAKNAQ